MDKQTKVFFLDDNEERFNSFIKPFKKRKDIEVKWVLTSKDAIENLVDQNWDVICLDHDLGGKGLEQSGLGTGYEVAEYISGIPYYNDKLIFIHSWNPEGAKNMKKIIKRPLYIPFNNDYGKIVLDYIDNILNYE